MDDSPAQPVASDPTSDGLATPPTGGGSLHRRVAAMDDRERRLDLREAQITRRERANDLHDLAADRRMIDDGLYPARDD